MMARSGSATAAARLLSAALLEDAGQHADSEATIRRRRVVVCFTLAAGVVLLGLSLSVRAGDAKFYPLTAALAATWLIGGLVSGPIRLGQFAWGSRSRRPIVVPIVVGLAAAAVFLLGALVVREFGPLDRLTEHVLAHARRGSLAAVLALTLVNGVTEEVFFRGALFAAIGRRQAVVVSTAIYTIATMATGNVMLVFAAATLGILLAAERRASGGVLAPILTHVTWAAVMVVALPPIFG